MTAPAATAYDEVLYPNRAFPQTHPERLATIATLYGLHPAPPTQCRVLEIGCGHGWNLFPMAYDLPESDFLGFDIAARPIALGTEDARQLGLTNLRLFQQDIMDDSQELGTFDYIIAHGVYTWTPPAVRDRVLALCHAHLAPHGVAFISYATYPGSYMGQMTREMMRFHMQHFEGTHNRIRQARAMLKLLVEAQAEDTPYRILLEHAYQRVRGHPDEYLYHDDLSEIREPCYFHQFAEHAQQHRLQYLSEAVYFENFNSFPPHVQAALDSLGSNLLREQYLDFFHGRKFRQSLLCHQDVSIQRETPPWMLRPMYIAAPARRLEDVGRGGGQPFEGLNGSFAETDVPLDQAALNYLGEQWPAFVAFEELLDVARARIGATASYEEDRQVLAQTLLQLYRVNFLEMHLRRPSFATTVSERPLASPIARFQAQSTPYVSTLTFGSIRLQDPVAALVLSLLDGTRSRADLVAALGVYLEEGGLVMKQQDEPITDPVQAKEALKNRLDDALARMAQEGLLLA